MSRFINIEDLEEEMALAEPIVNNFGQVLLPSGVIIKDSHKKILRTWNIRIVAIKGEDDSLTDDFSDELKKLAMEKLEKRMLWQPRNNIEIDLINVAVTQSCRLMTKVISKTKG